MWLVCKTRAKILFFDPEKSLTTPRLLPWGDRDDHMETTNRPSRPDRLEIFWNDWGDRDDPDDHMETRLKRTLNNPFAPRLAKFDTALKRLRIYGSR